MGAGDASGFLTDDPRALARVAIVLFEDRGTPHTAEESREVAAALGIEVRLLPRATPELNAMDHLWRQVKGRSGEPPDALDRRIGRRRLPLHYRDEPARAAQGRRSPLG